MKLRYKLGFSVLNPKRKNNKEEIINNKKCAVQRTALYIVSLRETPILFFLLYYLLFII